MRNATIVGIFTLLIALCAMPCAAQSIPPGSYQQTCRNVYAQGDRLQAECQTHEGRWLRTTLDDVDSCRGQIVNNDGNLTCAQGNYQGGNRDWRARRGNWQNGLPPGDYVQTCRNISMNGDRLQAECQERDGDWRRTSLDDVDRCTGYIANDNGRLVCPQGEGSSYGDRDRDRGRGGIPAGTYTDTCRNIHVEGDRLMAECQKRNGDWRQTSLNDFQRCASAPANDNGRLVCSGR